MHPLLNTTELQTRIYFVAALLFLVFGISILVKGFRSGKSINIILGAVITFFGLLISLTILFKKN